MEGQNGVARSNTDELDSSDIQRYQMEGGNGVAGSIIDELHSSDMVKRKVKVVLPEVPLMNFFLETSKQIK